MKSKRFLRGLLAFSFGLALALAGTLQASAPAPMLAGAPDFEAQTFSYSIARDSPSVTTGVHPADLLGAGGVLLIACGDLGLLCDDPTGGTVDDIVGLSFGDDFAGHGAPPVDFSVRSGGQGLAGTAVRAEAGCTPAEAGADGFAATLNGSNSQDLDGDGVACAANAGYGLALVESPTADEVDALAQDPCAAVDDDCDGTPEHGVLLTLGPDSPTLAAIGATSADILLATAGELPEVWATGAALGLRSGDVVDGLCVGENGDGSYGAGDRLLLSLRAGSPSLGAWGLAAGDLLRAPLRRAFGAAQLGLAAADDVDALQCGQDVRFEDLYLPSIQRR